MRPAFILVAGCILSVAAAGVSPIPEPKPNALAELHVSGTRFDIGQTVGEAFAKEISTVYHNSSGIQAIASWVETPAGAAAYASIVDTAVTWYPESAEELEGLAAGSGLSPKQVWLLNVAKELGPLARAAGHDVPLITHCSDVMVPRADGKGFVHGHNEDSGVLDYTRTYLLFVNASHDDGTHDVAYVAYTYAGQLSSGAFAFNEHGVYFSTNALFPTAGMIHVPGGVPRDFLQRRLLSATSLDEAVALANNTPLAGGFNLNVGSLNASDPRLFTLELSSLGANVKQIKPVSAGGAAYWHFNMYLRSPGVNQTYDVSSAHRLNRSEAIPLPVDRASVLNSLGDTGDAAWPIYRTATPPDGGVTIVTALFDTAAGTAALYMNNPAKGQPGSVDGPLMTLRWPTDLQNA